MLIPGHIAGGWLVTRQLTNSLGSLSGLERRRLLILGTIVGTLPDWDYIWYVIQKGRLAFDSDFRHHTWVTHTFPFYLIPAALLFLVGTIRKNRDLEHIATIFAASTSIHLILDAIGTADGIMLLYPFSKRMFGIALSGIYGKEGVVHYMNSPVYLVELTLVVIVVVTLLYDLARPRL